MNRIECIKNIKQYLLEQVENKVNFLNRCTLDIYGVNATKEQAIFLVAKKFATKNIGVNATKEQAISERNFALSKIFMS